MERLHLTFLGYDIVAQGRPCGGDRGMGEGRQAVITIPYLGKKPRRVVTPPRAVAPPLGPRLWASGSPPQSPEPMQHTTADGRAWPVIRRASHPPRRCTARSRETWKPHLDSHERPGEGGAQKRRANAGRPGGYRRPGWPERGGMVTGAGQREGWPRAGRTPTPDQRGRRKQQPQQKGPRAVQLRSTPQRRCNPSVS